MKQISRIHELESLRGVMALWVLVNHAIHVSGLHSEQWISLLKYLGKGAYAVDVFILLSGFVIFLLIDISHENYKRFITRRFFRLFPAYIFYFLIAVLIAEIAITTLQQIPWPHPNNQHSLRILQSSLEYKSSHILAHLTMLHGLIPNAILPYTDYAFLGPAWSISLEWQFYLVAPFLYFIILRSSTFAAIISVIIIALSSILSFGSDGFLLSKIHLFFIGAFSYFIFANKNRLSVNQKLLPIITISIIAAAAFTSNSIAILIWTITFVSLLATSLGSAGFIEKSICYLLNTNLFRFFGKISYSVYLSHISVIYLIANIYLKYSLFIDNQWLFFTMLLLSSFSLTILISFLSYKYIEKPGMDFAKKFST